MLGLSLCQYIGVKMPHKHAELVTKRKTILSLASMACISFFIPALLPMGVSLRMVEKLQLHIAFQLTTICLCGIYAALGREYLRQVKRARTWCASNVEGATCVRIRDRSFTRANLMLLASVTGFSVPIMISWQLAVYDEHFSSPDVSKWTSKTISITIFFLKIALDPLTYCLRLTIYRRAFKRILKLRVRRIEPRCSDRQKTGVLIIG